MCDVYEWVNNTHNVDFKELASKPVVLFSVNPAGLLLVSRQELEK